MKLNLGCGKNKKEGYLNCDISSEINPDKVVNITEKLPFDNNSVSEIFISHTLEHTHEPLEVLREFYRICKHEATIKILVPYFSSESAFSQIDHYSFFSYTTFDFLDSRNKLHYQGVGNFQIIYKRLHWRKYLFFFEKLFNLFPRVYQEFFCWWFPARELEIELKVIKGEENDNK